MSDFNPNAYGRPTTKPSPVVVSPSKLTPKPSETSHSNLNNRNETNFSSARLPKWSLPCDDQQSWQSVNQQSIDKSSNYPTDTQNLVKATPVPSTDDSSIAEPPIYTSQHHSFLKKHTNSRGNPAANHQTSTTCTSDGTETHRLKIGAEDTRKTTSTKNQNILEISFTCRTRTPEDQANGGAAIPADISGADNSKTAEQNQQAPSKIHQSVVSSIMQSEIMMTPEELLSKAREASLKKIQLRNKAKEKNSTTSLNDLNIARTPISESRAQSVVNPKDTSTKLKAESRLSVRGQNKTQQPTPPKSAKRKASQSEKPQNAQPIKRTSASESATDNGPSSGRTLNVMKDDLRPEAELKPVGLDISSGLPGTPIASDASEASKDSVTALHAGKAVHPLMGWDGSFQPPPADWNDRHGLNPDESILREDVEQWTDNLCHLTTELDDRRFRSIPKLMLKDVNDTPDGISVVPKFTMINRMNANRYGYKDETVDEIVECAQPLTANDFLDWGKVDQRKPENALVANETAEDLISNWMKHHKLRQMGDAQIEHLEESPYALPDCKPAPNPNRPIANIYLRPACNIDVPQMTQLYNWYIQNTPRPAETMPVGEEEIQERLDDVRSTYLPFIVAVDRSLRSVPSDAPGQEKILGWACAQNFTASDYIERISVELELYIHPEYRQLGVGRCLMDKLIEACDRGYMKRGGYPFRCPQEHIHLYSPGGGRDLHKLVFVLRKWKNPKGNHDVPAKSKYPKANLKMKPNDQEDDYNLWIKGWLESWGFEVEGVLKGVGAKNGRFVDVVHFGRETRWQPMEGKIPDPLPRMY